MQDENTYGFSKRDAEDLIASVGNGDRAFESRVQHSVGGMQLGRTGAGGIGLTAPANVLLYEETTTGYSITANEVECWTFKTAIAANTDVAIWESGTRLVAFEIC